MARWTHTKTPRAEWLSIEGSEICIQLTEKDRPDFKPCVFDGEYSHTAEEALKLGQDLIEAATFLRALNGICPDK